MISYVFSNLSQLWINVFVCSCQFVIRDDADYKMNLMDPDMPLKWEHIEEVVSRLTYSALFHKS